MGEELYVLVMRDNSKSRAVLALTPSLACIFPTMQCGCESQCLPALWVNLLGVCAEPEKDREIGKSKNKF